ncbi:hypothetical protein V2J09_003748 [Rumex salicifolius]
MNYEELPIPFRDVQERIWWVGTEKDLAKHDRSGEDDYLATKRSRLPSRDQRCSEPITKMHEPQKKHRVVYSR